MAAKKEVMNMQMDFEQDSGKGIENADSQSIAIPFLFVVQPTSPQIEEIAGCKPGAIMNSVTNQFWMKQTVIPVYFRRAFLAWLPRNEGGTFGGEHSVVDVEKGIASGKYQQESFTDIITEDGYLLKDTRLHYVLYIDEGVAKPAVISMASTQIKYSKRWLARINELRVKKADGEGFFHPPSFAHDYIVSTFREENSQGKWYSWKFEPGKWLDSKVAYWEAKRFYESIQKGAVKVDHVNEEQEDAF